jgi:iron complex transport system substrate-binding protein
MSLNPASPSTSPSAPTARQVSLSLFAAILVIAAAVSIGGTAAYFELRPSSHAGTTVVDDLGRKVSVPTDPGRVIVLAPSVMDLVYRLGLRSSVVAVGCTASLPGGIFNEYSPNQTTLWDLTNASCIADYPTLNTEQIALEHPQVVLASTITSALAVGQLTSVYGIPVVIFAPATLEGIVGDVRIMAQIFPEAASTATALELSLQAVLNNATAWDTNFSNNNVSIPSVLLTYYFDDGGYYTYGPGSFGDSLISLAGGDNIADSVPLLYAEFNASAALADQPQVIVYGTSNDSYLVSGETPADWPAQAPYWSDLNGTEIGVDITLVSEADPSMIYFLPLLMHWLHPTIVPAP